MRRDSGLPGSKQSPLLSSRFIICCEGEGEQIYLDLVRQELRLSKRQVIITAECGTDPFSIVQAADNLRAEEQRARAWRNGDTAWAVFDGDEHIQNDRQHWDQALDYARRKGIQTIISNPNLELWYLLHYKRQAGGITKEQVRDALRQYIPDYDKKVSEVKRLYDDLRAGQRNAIARAVNLVAQNERNTRELHANPSTRMHVLLEELHRIRTGSR